MCVCVCPLLSLPPIPHFTLSFPSLILLPSLRLLPAPQARQRANAVSNIQYVNAVPLIADAEEAPRKIVDRLAEKGRNIT